MTGIKYKYYGHKNKNYPVHDGYKMSMCPINNGSSLFVLRVKK